MSEATLIKETTPIARKDYLCDSYDLLIQMGIGVSELDLTVDEKRAIAKARQNKGLIKKGEKYIRQINYFLGKYTWRAIPELHQLCIEHQLYGD